MSAPLRWRKSSHSDPNNCLELAWSDWRKSSRSDPNECVELAWSTWRTSSHSDPTDCVELAWAPARAALRDSKNPHGPTLSVDRPHFATFIATLKATLSPSDSFA